MPASQRVPPESAELSFAEYRPTGTVHIEVYVPERWDEGVASGILLTLSECTGDQIMDAVLGYRDMLCGARFPADRPGAAGEAVEVFDDDRICGSCVRALGSQSARAFAHRRPGDPEDE